MLALAAITFGAASQRGLGYGFSSITVPARAVVFTNRRLNPALVLIELALNAGMLL